MATETISTTPVAPIRLTWLLVASIAAYGIANVTWWLQPILIDQLIMFRGYTASWAGLVVSTEMTAMALAAAALAKFQRSGRYLTICLVGAGVTILASYASLYTVSLGSLILTRTLVGLGEAPLLMIANTAMRCFPDPDKAFGKLGIANVLIGILLVHALGYLHTQALPGFVTLLVAICVLTPLLLLMPPGARLQRDEHRDTKTPSAIQSDVRWRICLISASTFFIGVASGVMWSFYAIIGHGTGLSDERVDGAIGVAILSAVVGSSLTAMIGNRWGRIGPVTIALFLMTAAIVALSYHPGPYTFRVATCINVASLYFIVPYLFGAGSAQDPSGRGATFVSSAFFLTGALSPFLGGLLLDHVGIEVVGIGVILTSIIAWWLFLKVNRLTPISHPIPL